MTSPAAAGAKMRTGRHHAVGRGRFQLATLREENRAALAGDLRRDGFAGQGIWHKDWLALMPSNRLAAVRHIGDLKIDCLADLRIPALGFARHLPSFL